ncbi:MAG: PhoD-like phosphatase N-terminal domain-containing protein, partial [Ramlibacter sp.]|nr:PhoD-like phosphatase N-terminal domain-containing protein [Ramlibacter sp.]
MAELPLTDRRRLLQLALDSATGQGWPGGAQTPFASDPFQLGVASGSPAADSVVLWTRLLGPHDGSGLAQGPVPMRWEVAHDEQFIRMVRCGDSQA